ncbi:MAG: hypothetical protein PVI78_06490 [Anaerolineales bacterium]
MSDQDASRKYLSFLLRMWKQRGDAWLFSLEDPVTGSRMGFDSLGSMLDFLIRLIKNINQGKEH